MSRTWAALELDRAVRLRAAGLTHREVAAALGRTVGSVASALLYWGRSPHRPRDTAARREQVRALARTVRCQAEIAARLGVTRQVVSDDFRVLNLGPGLSRQEAGRRSARRVRLAGCRPRAERVAAAAAGWPPCSRWYAANLGRLYAAGPTTAAAFAAGHGLNRRNVNKWLRRAALAGHVVRAGGRLWDLAPAVRERRRAHLALTSADVPE